MKNMVPVADILLVEPVSTFECCTFYHTNLTVSQHLRLFLYKYLFEGFSLFFFSFFSSSFLNHCGGGDVCAASFHSNYMYFPLRRKVLDSTPEVVATLLGPTQYT